MAALITATAGYVKNGDTVVMPCGGLLEVARWELFAPGEVALFSDCGERWIISVDREVGFLSDISGRL